MSGFEYSDFTHMDFGNESEEVYHLMNGEQKVGLLNLSDMTFNYNGDYKGELPVELFPNNDINYHPTQYYVIRFIKSRSKGCNDYITALVELEKTNGVLSRDDFYIKRITIPPYFEKEEKEEDMKWIKD